MIFSKRKISKNVHELRVRTRGRARKEWKRRFDSNKSLEDELQCLIKLSALDESYVARFMSGAKFEDLVNEHLDPNAKRDGMLNKFSEELDYWKKHRYPKFSPGWRKNIDGYIAEFVELQRKRVSDINAELLDQIDFLLDDEGNSRKTINLKIGWIKAVLNFSVERKRIAFNPVAHYKLAKPPTPVLEFWERAEALSFLHFADRKYPRSSELRWRYMAYLTALNAVPRAGELWALRVRSLRKGSGVIAIQEQYDATSKEFRELKGKEARTAPLNAELLSEMQNYVERNRLGGNSLLFSLNGAPIEHDSFRLVFEKDLQEWGGKRIKFHGLRHSGATLMIAAGVDIHTVKEILGHKDINTTLRYLHALAESVKLAGKAFALGLDRPTLEDPPPPPFPPMAARERGRVRHLQLVV